MCSSGHAQGTTPCKGRARAMASGAGVLLVGVLLVAVEGEWNCGVVYVGLYRERERADGCLPGIFGKVVRAR